VLITSLGFAENNLDPVSIELVPEYEIIQSGQEFHALLRVKLSPDWHLYWKNPGDVGLAPTLNWKLPEGVAVKEVAWPAPQRFESGDATTFGYTEEAVFHITFTSEKNLPNIIEIQAELQWVVCSSETCLPGESGAQASFHVGSIAKIEPRVGKHFAQAREALPQKITPEARFENAKFVFDLPDSQIAMNDTALFFPEEGMSHKNAVTLNQQEVALEANNMALKGVLVVGQRAYDIDFIHTSPVESLGESINWGWALLFALVGGLILNLMPCVLPVVSLKIMNFMQMSNQLRTEQLKHATLFSMGIMASFWTLALLLIALQATGQAVGWGFQLQNPFVIASLAILFTLLGLNLFGVFEMGTSVASYAGAASHQTSAKGYSASFCSGIFATAVATPCTGPFMGSALGYALMQPAYVSLSIFTALGLGMSLPYLLIGAFPSLIRWMPKPGAWMESFKQFLGFLMLATVIWLLWVFSGQTSQNALFFLLFALLILALGAWIFGRWGHPIKSKAIRRSGYALAALCLGSALFIAFNASNAPAEELSSAEIAKDWELFSTKRLQELREQNIPVLIDFTAKWCLICQTNHWALSQPAVTQALDAKKIVRMKADWTRHDPEITAELQKHGRSGVPLYVLYNEKSGQAPLILPQVLKTNSIIDAVNTYIR
jgi:thiol:disulfide interchange protein DsbD